MKCLRSIFAAGLLPLLLNAAPGNIFVEGEVVSIRLPENASKVTFHDVEGQLIARPVPGSQHEYVFGKLPPGYFRADYLGPDGKAGVDGFVVLPQPVDVLNPSSPVAVDAALFYPFFLRKRNATLFSYTPEDVLSILRKGNFSYVRERISWTEFNYLDSRPADPLVDELMAAYRKHGIRVLQSLYGTPPQWRYPAELSSLGAKKPPLDLTKIHHYAAALVRRFGSSMSALESWNEPEGIGGGLLNFETAAVQKAAMLGVRQADPDRICFMGFGTPEHAGNLASNDLNSYQNVFCIHAHSRLNQLPGKIREIRGSAAGLPIWMSEISCGSFPVDPATGELSAEQALRQAADIPKLYATALSEGAEKLFYFFLFQHTEVSGQSFGLLRHSDLSPRPGFATLAVLANYFQNFHGIEPLRNLPEGVIGYEARVIYRQKPYRVQLLWSVGKPRRIPLRNVEFARDAFGREVETGTGIAAVGEIPLYVFMPSDSEAPPAALPRKAVVPTSIVLNLELPDSVKNTASDSFALPVGETRTYPLAIYNFSGQTRKGFVMVTFPGGEAPEFRSDEITLPPGSRNLLPIPFKMARETASGFPARLVIKGEFGDVAGPVLAASVTPVRLRIAAGDTVSPIPGWETNGIWRKHLSKSSEMTVGQTDGWTVFDYRFGPAENRVVGHVWASPEMALNIAEFPECVPDAVAFEMKLLEGDGVETLGLNLVEKGGATYFGTLDFREEQLREGCEFLVPLSSMVNPKFRKQDDNGRLDLEQLVALEFPLWAKPERRIRLAVRNLRWVNYQKEDERKQRIAGFH